MAEPKFTTGMTVVITNGHPIDEMPYEEVSSNTGHIRHIRSETRPKLIKANGPFRYYIEGSSWGSWIGESDLELAAAE